jgi:hypothetical protein
VKKIVWAVIGIGILLWSALAWLVHSLVGWGGSLASGNADVLTPHPETVEWLSWLAQFGTNVGEWIVIAIWGLGVALALLIGTFSSRFTSLFGRFSEKLKHS